MPLVYFNKFKLLLFIQSKQTQLVIFEILRLLHRHLSSVYLTHRLFPKELTGNGKYYLVLLELDHHEAVQRFHSLLVLLVGIRVLVVLVVEAGQELRFLFVYFQIISVPNVTGGCNGLLHEVCECQIHQGPVCQRTNVPQRGSQRLTGGLCDDTYTVMRRAHGQKIAELSLWTYVTLF